MKTLTPARREILRPKIMLRDPKWFKGTGTLVYDPKRKNKKNTHDWLVLEVDREITRYFRWFIDHELVNITGAVDHGVLQPSGDAHVSVLRGAGDLRNIPRNHRDAMWKKYQGRKVDFLYSPEVKLAKGKFWYVEVKCPWLLELREWEWDVPFDFGMHLTVAKMRDHWIEARDDRFRNPTWNGKI